MRNVIKMRMFRSHVVSRAVLHMNGIRKITLKFTSKERIFNRMQKEGSDHAFNIFPVIF